MRVQWAMLIAAVGCGGASRDVRELECRESSALGYAPACSAPTIELAVDEAATVAVVRQEITLDGEPVGEGLNTIEDGEHVLAVELELDGSGAGAAHIITAERRVSVAAGCTLHIELVTSPAVADLQPAVDFVESLRCENALHAEASIPEPRALASLPEPIGIAPLERWSAECVDNARAADRYVALAVGAALHAQDLVAAQCFASTLDRIATLREAIEGNATFAAAPPAELTRDATLVRSVCLRVLDLQAKARQCI